MCSGSEPPLLELTDKTVDYPFICAHLNAHFSTTTLIGVEYGFHDIAINGTKYNVQPH